MKTKIVTRKELERGSNRPYAALLYMGFSKMPQAVYENATITRKYGVVVGIHAVYVSQSTILIITE